MDHRQQQRQRQRQLSAMAAAQLLQHTLRSLCTQDGAQWVYAVFWRILPRNHPPPKWDLQAGIFDRNRANRRNWILAWEEAYCDFAAAGGLQPELFFKLSHDIYNYGEGLVGKVAADHSHKWVYRNPQEQSGGGERGGAHLPSWSSTIDSQPRTWEAQFQSGIKTIALVAVREGVVQLGAVQKVAEDLSYVVQLRRKFSYLESIPGVLLPHPSVSPSCPLLPDIITSPAAADLYDAPFAPAAIRVTPSMSSLEALLSKLPPVPQPLPAMTTLSVPAAKMEDDGGGMGESSSGPLPYWAAAKQRQF